LHLQKLLIGFRLTGRKALCSSRRYKFIYLLLGIAGGWWCLRRLLGVYRQVVVFNALDKSLRLFWWRC
jgi:hypothetical protein